MMEINDPDFRRDNPDIWVQAAFQALDKAKEMRLKEPIGEAIERTGYKEAARNGQMIHSQKCEVVNGWGVPARICENLKAIRRTKAVKLVEDFASAPKEAWCLVLSADKGAGKSTAAAFWLMEQVHWRHYPESRSSGHARAGWSPPQRWWSGTKLARTNGYSSDFEKMIKIDSMVIDDLGIEYLDKNGNFLQRFDELMDERYSNFRKTIITTNLNAEDFKSRYGERVADRIREGFNHGGAFMELSDKSLRSVK
jgi:hypothetical protein